jgi:transcriptional regulator with XRE-family HTH domain
MIFVKQSPPYRNGHRNPVLVEPLSARVFRLRIGLSYSVYELAEDSGVFVGTIKRLEAGKPVDKRELPALAAALRVLSASCFAVTIAAPNEPARPP